VLGVLRSDEDERAPREPSASLARLGDLVRGAAGAGLAVDVESDGGESSLPTDVSLAAYRIVQEALTNSARHSGGGRAVVRLARGERDLVIEVDDDGPGTAAADPGNGIIGMTERAHALGGTLEAGPRPEGGFRVRARLPLINEETP
jgi:signal transduction histidine kinase